MGVTVFGITLQTPPELNPDEAMVSWLGEGSVRTNLILHRRRLSGVATLSQVAAEIAAELRANIPELGELNVEEFAFADGCQGALIGFTYQARAKSLRQLQSVRVDGTRVTTLTLTLDAAVWEDGAQRQRFLTTLASPQETQERKEQLWQP